jgi:hypothetical protein
MSNKYQAAYEKHGSYRKAGAALGVHFETVRRHVLASSEVDAAVDLERAERVGTTDEPRATLADFCRTDSERKAFRDGALSAGQLRVLKARAASKGWAPEADYNHPVPAPFLVKGISQYRNAKGEVTGEWIKSVLDAAQYEEALRAGIDELLRDTPAARPQAFCPHSDSDLLTIYEVGDPHIGMLAWAQETGQADWDLTIALETHRTAFADLVARSPASATCDIFNAGDWFHTSNHAGISKSGHRFDTDSRLPKMYAAGMRIAVDMVEQALTKHAHVHWRGVRGNHDFELAYAFACNLQAYYRQEPRVTVHVPSGPTLYHEFGKNLIGYIHGDGAKGMDLPRIMANDQAPAWGRTWFRFFKHGHVHSRNGMISVGKEHQGAIVESVPNLPPNDAWHAENQWRSGRAMQADVLHKTKGRIERLEHHIPPRTE